MGGNNGHRDATRDDTPALKPWTPPGAGGDLNTTLYPISVQSPSTSSESWACWRPLSACFGLAACGVSALTHNFYEYVFLSVAACWDIELRVQRASVDLGVPSGELESRARTYKEGRRGGVTEPVICVCLHFPITLTVIVISSRAHRPPIVHLPRAHTSRSAPPRQNAKSAFSSQSTFTFARTGDGVVKALYVEDEDGLLAYKYRAAWPCSWSPSPCSFSPQDNRRSPASPVNSSPLRLGFDLTSATTSVTLPTNRPNTAPALHHGHPVLPLQLGPQRHVCPAGQAARDPSRAASPQAALVSGVR